MFLVFKPFDEENIEDSLMDYPSDYLEGVYDISEEKSIVDFYIEKAKTRISTFYGNSFYKLYENPTAKAINEGTDKILISIYADMVDGWSTATKNRTNKFIETLFVIVSVAKQEML
jgi:hypothetical protein